MILETYISMILEIYIYFPVNISVILHILHIWTSVLLTVKIMIRSSGTT